MYVLLTCSLLMLLSGMAAAQTVVETAILTGATGTATAAKGTAVSGAVKDALGKVNNSLSGAKARTPSKTITPKTTRSSAARSWQPSAPKPVLPKATAADLEKVEIGMSEQQLIARVGQPACRISSSEKGRLMEILSYSTKEGASADIRVTDGKVSSIDRPVAK